MMKAIVISLVVLGLVLCINNGCRPQRYVVVDCASKDVQADLEDIICLFNGRETVVDEIACCDPLRKFLAVKFAEYLAEPDLGDAVEGFVQTEPNPDSRKRMVLERFARVSRLGVLSDRA